MTLGFQAMLDGATDAQTLSNKLGENGYTKANYAAINKKYHRCMHDIFAYDCDTPHEALYSVRYATLYAGAFDAVATSRSDWKEIEERVNE